MKIKTMWIVTKPKDTGEIIDILFECDIHRLQLQFKGGLEAKEIDSMYTDYKLAAARAIKLMEDLVFVWPISKDNLLLRVIPGEV